MEWLTTKDVARLWYGPFEDREAERRAMRNVQNYISRKALGAEKHGRDWFVREEEAEKHRPAHRQRGRPRKEQAS